MLREKVIQKATFLFSRDGIKNVSMDELASSLRISKRTIYQNFDNKEDILRNCIIEEYKNLQQRFTKIISEADNTVIAFLQIINEYKSNNLPNGIFMSDVNIYYPDIYQSIKAQKEKYKNYMKELMCNGIKEKYFRQDINLDETILMLDINTYNPKIYIDVIYNMMVNILRGISTAKGLEIIDSYFPTSPYSNN